MRHVTERARLGYMQVAFARVTPSVRYIHTNADAHHATDNVHSCHVLCRELSCRRLYTDITMPGIDPGTRGATC